MPGDSRGMHGGGWLEVTLHVVAVSYKWQGYQVEGLSREGERK